MDKRIKKLGQNVKKLRIEKGMSQDDVADNCDVTKSNLSNFENGKKDIVLNTFLEIARGLNISPIEIFGKDFDNTEQ